MRNQPPDQLPHHATGAPLLKVCGATSRADVATLAAGGADLVGLWHGVAGGHADLDRAWLVELAAATEAAGRTPVLGTFDGDAAAVAGAMLEAGIGIVQLHGYQPPTVVRAIKAAVEGATVVKVLHVAGSECQEERLLRSYRRGGAGGVLAGRGGPRGGGEGARPGRGPEPAVARPVADAAMAPFLLAGGISAGNAERFASVRAHPGFLGVDVDSAARDADGRFAAARVAAIRGAWDRPTRWG